MTGSVRNDPLLIKYSFMCEVMIHSPIFLVKSRLNHRRNFLALVFIAFAAYPLWQHHYVSIYQDDYAYASLSYSNIEPNVSGLNFTFLQMIHYLVQKDRKLLNWFTSCKIYAGYQSIFAIDIGTFPDTHRTRWAGRLLQHE